MSGTCYLSVRFSGLFTDNLYFYINKKNKIYFDEQRRSKKENTGFKQRNRKA